MLCKKGCRDVFSEKLINWPVLLMPLELIGPIRIFKSMRFRKAHPLFLWSHPLQLFIPNFSVAHLQWLLLPPHTQDLMKTLGSRGPGREKGRNNLIRYVHRGRENLKVWRGEGETHWWSPSDAPSTPVFNFIWFHQGPAVLMHALGLGTN